MTYRGIGYAPIGISLNVSMENAQVYGNKLSEGSASTCNLHLHQQFRLVYREQHVCNQHLDRCPTVHRPSLNCHPHL